VGEKREKIRNTDYAGKGLWSRKNGGRARGVNEGETSGV